MNTNVRKTIEERLKPVKVLSESVNYDEDRIQVTQYDYIGDDIVLTLSDKFTGKEAAITLTPDEFEDYGDDFLKLIRFTDTPLFWFIRGDFATGAFKAKIFKEIKDVLLFKVSPLFESLATFEIYECEIVTDLEPVAA